MKKLLCMFICICLLATAGSVAAVVGSDSGRTFYVDSVNGSDDNQGTSEDQAWASLDKVNSMRFGPGDRILFKTGTVYTGQLKPQGSGSASKPIIIDMYGKGDKPCINGKGKVLDTLLLENVEYWEVSNLKITNLGAKRAKWRTPNGSGLGKTRWVVERTLSWLHQFRRLRIRYERRSDIHEAFLSIGCIIICWNQLNSFC